MARNYLKGALGDHINLLLAAVAWNLKQWPMANGQWPMAIFALFSVEKTAGFTNFLIKKLNNLNLPFMDDHLLKLLFQNSN